MYESFKILGATQCISDSMLTKSHGNSGHQINSNLMWIKRRTPNVWRSSVIKFQCFWIRQCAINLKMFFVSLRLGSTKTKIKTLECLKQSNFEFSYRSKWNSHKENSNSELLMESMLIYCDFCANHPLQPFPLVLFCLVFFSNKLNKHSHPNSRSGGIFKGRKGRGEQRRPSNSDPVQKKNCSFFF